MTKYKPKRMETVISQMDKKLVEWTPDNTRKEFITMANEFFDREIMKKNHKQNPKEWHKSVKKFSKYS